MQRSTAKHWLRHLGVTLLILGFVRMPLPVFHLQDLGHAHAAGEFCPISQDQYESLNERNFGNAKSVFGKAWNLALFSTLTCTASECEESNEDFSGDGECADPSSDVLNGEVSIVRSQSLRWSSKYLALSLDSAVLPADVSDLGISPDASIRSGICCNGTSPSYGPSFQALYERWAC